jgi:hypothetical protein
MRGRAALIGYSGFVGTHLKQSGGYTDFYNSKTIEHIQGEEFDVVVCSATPATKWLANKEPEQDWHCITRLMTCLKQVKARQFFLISTVDVFQSPMQVDETTPVPTEGLQPYGAHRYAFEQFVQQQFAHVCVVRLPALFGAGLKKNALYDLLHDNGLEKLPMEGVFQWYNVQNLAQDLLKVQDLPLVHLVTAPLGLQRVVDELFPDKQGCGQHQVAAHYDLRTIHAARFGAAGHYIAGADAVMQDMKTYVTAEQNLLAQAR